MDFEQVLDFRAEGERFKGTVPTDWRQGRTAYGGVVAAAGIKAMRGLVPPGRTLRHFNAQFVAPTGEGELEIEVRSLASGGNATTCQATFWSQDRPCLLLTAVFAAPRYCSKSVEAERIEQRQPDDRNPLPYLEGITPVFTQHIEYRWSEGGFPFSGQQKGALGGYCRHKTPAGAAEEATIGLLDAWPPAVLPLLDRPSPASTMSWSVHLYEPPEHKPGDWWFYRACPVRFQDGYATTQAQLYAPDGRLVAWSEQLVAVYEKS